MHIAILGAGVVGLTSAFALVEKGHRVTIIDRQPAVGRETSFGNGAQLSYAFVAPLASRSTLLKLPKMLLERDGPMQVRWSLDPDFIRWGLRFLRACNDTTERSTTLAQLKLASLSRSEISRMADKASLSFGLQEPGKLVVYRSQSGFEAAQRQSEAFGALGIYQEVASAARCLEIEPALKFRPGELRGGLFTPSEQVANCAEFCVQLAQALDRTGAVTWHMQTHIQRPIIEAGRIKAIGTSAGDVEAEAYILAMGTGSSAFARAAGFYLPVQPLKGYSLTTQMNPGSHPLTRSVTDFDNKTVFAPMSIDGSSKIRIAGMADMMGPDLRLDTARIDQVRKLSRQVLDIDTGIDDRPWAGLRPATPDSRPIIGTTPVANLYLNTGHGGLGWTLAAGSARLCAEIINGDTPSLAPETFSLATQ